MKYLETIPVLEGRRVTVMGLGLFGGGLAAARYCARQGARVTVTDLKPEEALRESVVALDGFPIIFHLGGHVERDFTDTDLVVVNPGVAPDSPWLAAAERAGVLLETELNLFWKLCPAPIAAVTGSNGKTTTTALLGAMIAAGTGRELIAHDAPWPEAVQEGAMRGRVWVGGNIGRPLLEAAALMTPQDWAVVEVSSFQFEALAAIRRAPRIAVVTNLQPNHLDRHGTMEAYEKAKFGITEHQTKEDVCVLNADDAIISGWKRRTRARVHWFGRTLGPVGTRAPKSHEASDDVEDKAHRESERGSEHGPRTSTYLIDRALLDELPGEWLAHASGCCVDLLGSLEGRRLIGRFNLENITAAAAAALELCSRERNPSEGAFPPIDWNTIEAQIAEGVRSQRFSLKRFLTDALGLTARVHGKVSQKTDSSPSDSTSPDSYQAAIAAVARTFPGVEHRLEYVATVREVAYYNDSIATNPDSVICALDALAAPVILLAGGSDKQLPFDRLAAKIAEKAKRCILFGATAEKILAAVTAAGGATKCERVANIDDAVAAASRAAAPGDIVLLSPACASYDQFRNFTERGRRFKTLVAGLAESRSPAGSP